MKHKTRLSRAIFAMFNSLVIMIAMSLGIFFIYVVCMSGIWIGDHYGFVGFLSFGLFIMFVLMSLLTYYHGER